MPLAVIAKDDESMNVINPASFNIERVSASTYSDLIADLRRQLSRSFCELLIMSTRRQSYFDLHWFLHES